MEFKTTEWEQSLHDLPSIIHCEDELQQSIKDMKEHTKKQKYENAREQLEKIKKMLDEEVDYWHSEYDPCRKKNRTLLAIHDQLRNNAIRLNHKEMNLVKYLDLLQEIQFESLGKDVETPKMREITAENMIRLNLPPQNKRGKKAPNRAFMDVLYQKNPQFARDDLTRREKTKLWYALERNDPKSKEEIRKQLKDLRKSIYK